MSKEERKRFAASGGRAKWASMTQAERKAAIAKMVRARKKAHGAKL